MDDAASKRIEREEMQSKVDSLRASIAKCGDGYVQAVMRAEITKLLEKLKED